MGVVKTVKRIARAAGGLVDADDREVLGTLIIWSLGLFSAAAVLGATLGILVQVARIVSGA